MMQLDYTFERQIELEREAARSKAWEQGMERGIEQGIERGIEQGIERGIEQGIERGRLREIIAFVQDGDISVERGAQKAGMTVDEFQKVMAEAEQTLLLK